MTGNKTGLALEAGSKLLTLIIMAFLTSSCVLCNRALRWMVNKTKGHHWALNESTYVTNSIHVNDSPEKLTHIFPIGIQYC